MTKFFSAQPQTKAKPLPQSSNEDQMFPAIISEPGPWLPKSEEVVFVLRDGVELIAKVDGLEDDGTVIYGNLKSGRAFATPISSVLYCMEA